VRTVHVNEDARVLTELFTKDLVALVVDEEKRLLGILTKMDLVDHLTGSVRGREVEHA
jgi:CBS domain-containing protein